RTYRGMYFLRLLRARCQSGTNGPNRLVSHHSTRKGTNPHLFNHATQLTRNDFQRQPSLTLLQRLANTQYRHQPTGLRCRELPGQHGIRLTQHLTALGMTDQHHAASSISQLTGRNLAGQSALHRFYCAVLRTDSNRFAFQTHYHLMEVKAGRHDRNLYTNRQRQLTKAFNQLRYAGAGTVHLPVTSYQWSTHAAPRRSK